MPKSRKKVNEFRYARLNQEIYLARADRARADVEAAKGRYFGAWNVLTDGQDDEGGGILRGGEWSDQKISESGIVCGSGRRSPE